MMFFVLPVFKTKIENAAGSVACARDW